MESFTVYLNYCFRHNENDKGSFMDFTTEKKALFNNIRDAIKYTNYNHETLNTRENSSFYISHKKDHNSKEKNVYYSGLKKSGYIY